MGSAMRPCFHCPLCDGDYPNWAAFDCPEHKCCAVLTPHIIERIAESRCAQRAKERRAIARCLAVFMAAEALQS